MLGGRPRELPRSAMAVLPRERLVSVVEQRFNRKITLVQGGAGLGKTTLLVSALSKELPSNSVDVWFPLRAGDLSAISLASELLSVLGSERVVTGDVGNDAEAIADALWLRSPERVCLLFDDAHVLPVGGEAEALLAAIVERLPPNGHVLLASRRSAPFPYSRQLVLGEAAMIDGDMLLFRDDECDQFAHQRNANSALVRTSGGWPALAELMISGRGSKAAVQSGAPQTIDLGEVTGASRSLPTGMSGFDFVWEEILNRIPIEQQRALRLLALAGSLDDQSFTTLTGLSESLRDLLDGLPLVSNTGSRFRLHDIWTEALFYKVNADTIRETRQQVAAFASTSDDHERAFQVLVGGGLWSQALESIRSMLVSETYTREPAELREWLGALPDEYRTDPVAVLLDGLSRRGAAPPSSIAALERAVSEFAERIDEEAELVGLATLSTMALNRGDFKLASKLYRRVRTLQQSGSCAASALLSVMNATMRLSEGFADDAVVIISAHPLDGSHSLRGMVAMVRARCLLEAGRLADTLDLLETNRRLVRPYRLGTETFRNRAIWQLGRHDEALALIAESVVEADRAGRQHDRDLASMMHAGYLALLGRLGEARTEILAFERGGVESLPFVRMNYRIARAMVNASECDDGLAARELRTFLSDAVFFAALPRAVLGMFYILVEEQRPSIDDADLRGMNATIREIAQALVAARVNDDLELARTLVGMPTDILLSHFAGPWLVELAVLCSAVGNSSMLHVLDDLGTRYRNVVVQLGKSPNVAIERTANRLLATIPVAAPSKLRLSVLGPIEIVCDGIQVLGDLKRDRVRALLLLVVIHRKITRERAAFLLWPELDVNGAANNLRTTLSYLQRTLEPHRTPDVRPFFLRQDGPWLTLIQDSSLDVDLWNFETQFGKAVNAENAHDPTTALAEYSAAAVLWRDVLGVDVANAHWAEESAELVRSKCIRAGIRASELLSGRDDSMALDLALRIRSIEPWSEQVHVLVARAHWNLGDIPAAKRALERGRRALDEIGVSPSASFQDLERSF